MFKVVAGTVVGLVLGFTAGAFALGNKQVPDDILALEYVRDCVVCVTRPDGESMCWKEK